MVAAVVMLAVVGCKTTPPAEAKAEEPETKVEYFPLTPDVKWDELNGLQKTTAAIAIVPGFIVSSLANAYLWMTQ